MSAGCIQSVGGVSIVYIAFISFLLILLGVRLRRSLQDGKGWNWRITFSSSRGSSRSERTLI